MSKTHTAKALAFCATPGLIIIAYSHYLRKNRLNQRRLFGAACSSGTLAATRSSPSESCCWIVPAWRVCAARAVSCAANNAVLHSANLAFNSLICTSFTASCACSVSTAVCKTTYFRITRVLCPLKVRRYPAGPRQVQWSYN